MHRVDTERDMPALPVDPEEFARLHAAIKPRPEELRWTQIPWEVDLWSARQRAVALGWVRPA